MASKVTGSGEDVVKECTNFELIKSFNFEPFEANDSNFGPIRRRDDQDKKIECNPFLKIIHNTNTLNRDMDTSCKPFKCGLCESGFARKDTLRRHMRNKHNLYVRAQRKVKKLIPEVVINNESVSCKMKDNCNTNVIGESNRIQKIVHYLNRDVDCYVYNVFRELESQIIDNDMDREDIDQKPLMLQLDVMKQIKHSIRLSVHNAYKELDLYIYNKLQVLETELTGI